MRRICPPYAYGPGPRDGCWWDRTITPRTCPQVPGEFSVDVAVIGAGFTGLNAALRVAQSGATVAVIEAERFGFGASGRNGGFCCVGGGHLDHAGLVRRFGPGGARSYSKAEHDAVAHVEEILTRYGIEADRHSKGETQLAHSARAWAAMQRDAEQDGANVTLTARSDLAAAGLNGPFFGAATTPVGFALNPRKYLDGLADAVIGAGGAVFEQSPVRALHRKGGRYALSVDSGQVSAEKVIVATNGYGAEDLPEWLGGRTMPVQSTVLVTRPLRQGEITAQGWHSDQMCFDSRALLHYFRRMPDGRFLFGMRGGIRASAASEHRARARVRRAFEKMFPAWADVETEASWSGMVCLTASAIPFAGEIKAMPGVFSAFGYHGNGVAMGSYCGLLVGELAVGRTFGTVTPMSAEPGRFPLGSLRRALLPPAYLAMHLRDAL